MIFKRKAFYKSILSLGIVLGVVPLAIACSNQGATFSNADAVSATKASFERLNAEDRTVNSDQVNNAPSDLSDVDTIEKINALIKGNVGIAQNVKITAAAFSLSLNEKDLTITFTLEAGEGGDIARATATLTMLGFTGLSADELAILNVANNLQAVSRQEVIASKDKTQKPAITTLADLNSYVQGTPYSIADSSIIPSFSVSNISPMGEVVISIILTKGAASREVKVSIFGFTPPVLNS